MEDPPVSIQIQILLDHISHHNLFTATELQLLFQIAKQKENQNALQGIVEYWKNENDLEEAVQQLRILINSKNEEKQPQNPSTSWSAIPVLDRDIAAQERVLYLSMWWHQIQSYHLHHPHSTPGNLNGQISFLRNKLNLNPNPLPVSEQVERLKTALSQRILPSSQSSSQVFQPCPSVRSRSSRSQATISVFHQNALSSTTGGVTVPLIPNVLHPHRLGQSERDPYFTQLVLETLQWESQETCLILTSPHFPPSHKIAAFDLDYTLITPKSGRKFPIDATDWQWLFPEIPQRLQTLWYAGWNIVIFSNQGGIERGKTIVSHLKSKILDICKSIQIPIQTFIASSHDKYRKPHPTMWKLMCERFNGGIQPSKEMSFFVGDAAGRSRKGTHKTDFSDSDLKFALNIGISFKTETEFFLATNNTSV